MKKDEDIAPYNLVVEWIENAEFKDYSYEEYEEAFWHLWTLNCYHVTLSFDINMVILLDWALSFHMERE